MSKNITMFKQLIEVIDRKKFNNLVNKHNSDRYVKQYSSWDHFVTLLYAQITDQESLRAIEINFNHSITREKFNNISKVKRSTLAEANQRRSSDFFKEVCEYLMPLLHNIRKDQREVKEVIKLIDSTPIQLRGRGLNWAESTQRITGLKAHFVYDLHAQSPIHFSFTSAKVNDVIEAQKMNLKSDTILIFDRAYYDFTWWHKITKVGSTFVSRPKSTLSYKVKNRFNKNSSHIKSDEEICLTSKKRKKYPNTIRLIKVWVEIRGKAQLISLITNNFSLCAERIAELYKSRWQIELFFKWIKQNLKIKKFISENENAIKIQIIMAIITYILIKILQMRARGDVTLRKLITFLKSHLFCTVRTFKNRRHEVILPKLLLLEEALS